MGLKIEDWNKLPKADKDAVINFLKGNCKIDLESPKEQANTTGAYLISDGTTSGGHPMKYGDEYRMYIKSLVNCQPFLQNECKSAKPPYKARIGGNDTIKAIMEYGGFKIGEN